MERHVGYTGTRESLSRLPVYRYLRCRSPGKKSTSGRCRPEERRPRLRPHRAPGSRAGRHGRGERPALRPSGAACAKKGRTVGCVGCPPTWKTSGKPRGSFDLLELPRKMLHFEKIPKKFGYILRIFGEKKAKNLDLEPLLSLADTAQWQKK